DHPEHHEAGAAQHHDRHGFDQRAHLRHQAEDDHDQAAGHADEAALDTRHADKTDVLAERGVGEGVEDAADQRAETVGAQPRGEHRLIHLLAGEVAEGKAHAGGLDHHHDHDQHHGEDHHRLEGRHAEVERRDHAEPGGPADLVEVHHAKRDRDRAADDDAEQNGDVRDEPPTELGNQKDGGQNN